MKENLYYVRPRSAAALLPVEAPVSKPEKKLRIGLPRERYIVAAGGLAAAALVGGVGQYMSDDPAYLPVGMTEMLMDYDCMAVSVDAKDRVGSALSTPNDPEFIDLLINAPDLEVPISNVPGYKAYQMRKASELGLTILDPEENLADLNSVDSKSEVIDGLNNFSKNYGFKFEIFKEGDIKSIRDYEQSFSGIRDEDLDIDTLKASSAEIIKVLSDTPVELGNLSNMHRVLLVRNIGGKDQNPLDRTLAIADSKLKSIYMDLEIVNRPEYIGTIFLHELSHGLDGTVCGKFGYERDIQFDLLNPIDFDYESDYANAEANSSVLTNYSNKNIIEDKAELMEQMITGLIDINSLDPVVRNKYTMQLTRLEENVAGITKYLRSVSIFSDMS